jgi:hypothetical protein
MQTNIASRVGEDDRLSPDTPVYEDTRHMIRRRYPAATFREPIIALPLGFGG